MQVRDEVQAAALQSIPPARSDTARQDARSNGPETLAAARQEPAPAPPQAAARKQVPVQSEGPRERLSQSAFDRLSSQHAATPSKLGSKRETPASKEDRSSSSPKMLAKSELDLAPPPVQGLGRVEELALDAGLAERSPAQMEAQVAAGSGLVAESEAPAPAAAPPAVASFMVPAAPKSPSPSVAKRLAKDKVEVQTKPRPGKAAGRTKEAASGATVDLFGNAVAPFELGLLGTGHFVLFRAVHRSGERLVQGLLIEQKPFLDAVLEAPFRDTPLAATTDLIVAFRDEVLAAYRARTARSYVV